MNVQRRRRREYANELLAQERGRRSALFQMGFTFTASLVAAFVALVGADAPERRAAAAVGALGLGMLGLKIQQHYAEARSRLIRAALRSELLRELDADESSRGRDVAELVHDVHLRTGEEKEQIWSVLPHALSEEAIAISIGQVRVSGDRIPTETAKRQLTSIGAAGLGAALAGVILSVIPTPPFLAVLDEYQTWGALPPFSVRGLINIGMSMIVAFAALQAFFPALRPFSRTLLSSGLAGDIQVDMRRIGLAAIRRARWAFPAQILAASALTFILTRIDSEALTQLPYAFATCYIAAVWFGGIILERAEDREIAKQLPPLLEALCTGDPPRVPMARLAKVLEKSTGRSIDTTRMASRFLGQLGIDARFWLE